MTDYDLTVWASACDSFFECNERSARIVAAYRVLAKLLPDNDDYPELWAKAVES